MSEYYKLEMAAEVLGVYPADLNEMREQGKVRAFRDGTNWKFKKEEIDDLAVELRSKRTAKPEEPGDEDSQDVLLSEVELGQSDAGASGTVIRPAAKSPEDSGISLVDPHDSSLSLDGSFDELDLTIEEDLQLDGSDVELTESPTELKADDEFLLSPLEEGADEEESGSQVIALDDPMDDDLASTDGLNGMAAMLDEEIADAGQGIVSGEAQRGERDSEVGSKVVARDDGAAAEEVAPRRRPSVFISYASQDRKIVERKIVRPLKRAGFTPWCDWEAIRGSEVWERSIHEALDSCDCFLIVLSPRSMDSEWVKGEFHYAVVKERRILPVLIETCDRHSFHFRLLQYQYFDFSGNWKRELKKLLAALE